MFKPRTLKPGSRTRAIITAAAVVLSGVMAPAIAPASAATASGSWTIPSYVESFQVFARGGRGGDSKVPNLSSDGQGEGANGCEVTATYLRGARTTVSWFIGGNGTNGSLMGGKTPGGVGVGGRNGGRGGATLSTSTIAYSGAAGGGATGVFMGTDPTSDAPVIIAAGGGGSSAGTGSGGSCADNTGTSSSGLEPNTMGGGYGAGGITVATAATWYRQGSAGGSITSSAGGTSSGGRGAASGPTSPDAGPSAYPANYVPGTTPYGAGGDGADQLYKLPDTPYGGGGGGGGGWAGGGGGAGAVAQGSGGSGAGGSSMVTGVAGAGYAPTAYKFRYNKYAICSDGLVGEGSCYGNFDGAVAIKTVKFFAAGAVAAGTLATPLTLGTAAPGYPYSDTITAKFGDRSITSATDPGNTALTLNTSFSVVGGALPTGLTLSPYNGLITGTANSTLPIGMTYSFQVRATMPTTAGILASSTSWYSIKISDPSLIPTVRGRSGTSQYGIAPASGAYDVSGLAASDWFTTITCKAQQPSSSPFDPPNTWINLTGGYPPGTTASAGYVNRCTGATTTGLGQTITYFNGDYEITKAPLTVRPKSWSTQFGTAKVGPTGAAAVEIVSGQVYNGNAIYNWDARTSTIVAGMPVGTRPITSGSGPTYSTLVTPPRICYNATVYPTSCVAYRDSYYDVTVLPGTWTITPAAALTVTASSGEYNFGEPAPVITETTTGWVSIDATPRWTVSRDYGAAGSYSYTAPTCKAYASAADAAANTNGFVPDSTTSSGTYITHCSGADVAGNYAGINYIDGTLVVKSIGVTIAPANKNITYGESIPALTYSGGDGITGITCAVYSGDTEVTGTPPAGTYIIRCTGPATVSVDGTDVPIVYSDSTLTVAKANLTITANSRSKQYGDVVTFAGTEFTTTGLRPGDAVTSLTLTSAGAVQSALYQASGYSIVPSSALGTGLSNYTINYVNDTLTVTRPTLTISARDYKYRAGTVPAPLGYDVSGWVNGETFATAGYSAPTCVALNSGTSFTPDETTTAGNYPISCSSAIAPNYVIQYAGGTLTVNSNVTVSVTGSSTYGQSLTLTPVLPDGVSSSGISCVLYSDATTLQTGTPVVGTAYIVKCSGPETTTVDGASVTIDYVDGAWTIDPAPLTITATDISKTFGESVTVFGWSLTSGSLAAGDTLTGVTIDSPGKDALAPVAGSPYAITVADAAGEGLSNYTIKYVNGTLTVAKADPLTVTPADYTFKAGTDPKLPLSETTTAFVNGDSYASEGYTAPICVAKDGQGNTVVIDATLAWGVYTISCSGAVAPNYSSVDMTPTAKLRVAPASITVTANTGSSVYGSSPIVGYAASPTASALAAADPSTAAYFSGLACRAVAGGVTATSATSVGSYFTECSGADTITVFGIDVPVIFETGTWTITKAQLTLSVDPISKPYGTSFGFDDSHWTLDGIQNGDAFTVSLSSAGTASNATVGSSPYEIQSEVTGGKLGNYDLVKNVGAFNVLKATLVVKPKNVSLNFAAQAPTTYTYELDTLKNGESESGGSKARGYIPPVCTSSYATTTPIGTAVDITCSNAAATDYDISYETATLSVQNSEVKVQNTTTNLAITGTGIGVVNLTANIDIPIAGCQVTFKLVPISPDGTESDAVYYATAYTDPLNASTWLELPLGVYYVSVSVSGNCTGASDDTGVLTVAPDNMTAGMGTTGGGWYNAGGGRINFGYVVQIIQQTTDKVTGDKTSVYRGEMLWTSKGKWRLKAHIGSTLVTRPSGGTISGFASWGTSTCPSGLYVTGSAPKCGSFIGTGTLQQWVVDSSGYGSWQDAKSVKFTTTVYDGGWMTTCKNKVCQTTDLSDYFGVKMTPLDGSLLPSTVPVTVPIQIKQGQIRIF